MCQSRIHPLLASIPKCEHHVHLEGTLSPELLFALADRNGVKLPLADGVYNSAVSYSTYLSRNDAFQDLDSFLSLYYTGLSVLQKQQDFHDLAMAYFHQAAQDNVRHAEVFFDPQAHTSRGIAYKTALAGFKSASAEAETHLGISSKLIMCFLRHVPAADAIEHYHSARPDLLNGLIAGIGLDSSEKAYPPNLFESVYALALKDNVRRTAHAGEEMGPHVVSSSLDQLHVERIDHGRTIPQDVELLSRIARERVLVTLCPLSNLKLQGVKSIDELPVRIFLDADVKFSINSDDPAYFGGFILDNYCVVQEAFNLTTEDWRKICKASIEGSWCDDSRKKTLLEELEVAIDVFNKKSIGRSDRHQVISVLEHSSVKVVYREDRG